MVSWLLVVIVVVVSVGCSAEPTAVERASHEVRAVVGKLRSAVFPELYQFTYTPLGPLTVGCLAGLESVDGVVDAGRGVAVFSPTERPGSVLSLEDGLLISADLLVGWSRSQPWARVESGAEPDQAAVGRLGDALGPTLSRLVAAGAWPTDPNTLVAAAVADAAQLAPIRDDEGRLGLRVVIDQERYEAELSDADGTPVPSSSSEFPPIIDVWLRRDGAVERMVVRRTLADDSSQVDPGGDGYAMDFRFPPAPPIDIPDSSDIATVIPDELPTEPTPGLCEMQM